MKRVGSTCDVRGRFALAWLVSGAVHALLFFGLLVAEPPSLHPDLDWVEMTLWEPPPPADPRPDNAVSPLPEVPEAPPPLPRDDAPLRPHPQPTEWAEAPEPAETPVTAPEPAEEPAPAPETAPEFVDEPERVAAPAVLDIDDHSFAPSDAPADFSLAPSEGNAAVGQVAAPGASGLRGTRPASGGTGAEAGVGKASVAPAASGSPRNWSRHPAPYNGPVALPPYPPKARRYGIEGKVRLRVRIGSDGRVREAEVLADPGGGLGDAARRAMLAQRWNPALGPKGEPVAATIVYTYNFVLR